MKFSILLRRLKSHRNINKFVILYIDYTKCAYVCMMSSSEWANKFLNSMLRLATDFAAVIIFVFELADSYSHGPECQRESQKDVVYKGEHLPSYITNAIHFWRFYL